ncbi:helix-turn-helix domain-containing protein, partial [Bacteroides thetaiotaomicron]
MNIGKIIKETRKSKGLKQQSFAKMCGITQTYLSQIENNVKDPT